MMNIKRASTCRYCENKINGGFRKHTHGSKDNKVNLLFFILLTTISFMLLAAICFKLLFNIMREKFGLYFYEIVVLGPGFFIEDLIRVIYNPCCGEQGFLMAIPILGTLLFWILFLISFYFMTKNVKNLKIKRPLVLTTLIFISFLAGFSVYSSINGGDLIGFTVIIFLILVGIMIKLTYNVYMKK